MMTNRRCPAPLVAKRKLGRAVHAPSLLSAAVAYLRRWAAAMCMKLQPFIGMGRLSLLSVFVFACAPFNVAAQTNAIAKLKAPTGFYVSVAEISPTFSIKFGTNGEYQVQIGPCGPLGCLSQKGEWKWDDQREEFLLTPRAPADLWHFDFRRFRVDKQEPDTLQWVSLYGAGNVLGMYHSVRFRRQGE